MHDRTVPARDAAFPVHGGEMAARIRAHDWAGTPLGPLDGWPQSLRTAVDLMLAAAAPVSVIWGPERIQLYNDAYIAIAGDRHPAALGRPVVETWAEAYETFLGPVLDRVFAGEAVALAEQAVSLRGHQGEAVERVFAASFSPIYDGAGDVAGVFHPLLETTERVAAERELKAERDRSRAILDSLGEGFVLLGSDFRVIDINAEGLRLDGRPREEIVGRSHWEAYPASVGTPVEAAYRRAMAERVPVELEHRYVDRAAGYDTWLDIRAYPQDSGLAVFYRDVSARKQDEEALRRRSEQLQGLAEVAQSAAHAPTLEATLDEITQAARRIVGAHQGVVSLTRGPDWSQAINTVALTDKYAAWSDYARMPDGSGIYAWLCEENRPVRFTQAELEAHPRWRGFGSHGKDHPPMRGWLAAPLVGRDGRNLGLIQLSDKEDGSEFDEADEAMLVQLAQIASAAVEQAQADAEMQEERTRLKLATAAGQIGIWDWDVDANRITASEHARAIFGAPTRQSFEPQEIFGLIHSEDRDRVITLSQRALDPKVRAHEPYEYRILHPDGTSRWVLAQGEAVFRDENGQSRPVRYFGTIQDITSRRDAEEAERRAAQRLRLAVESGRMAVWDLDAATNTVTGSPEMSRLLGFPEGEPIDADAARLRYCPGEYERISAEHAAAMARGQTSYDAEFRYQHPDLGVRWLRLRYDLVLDADGQPTRVLGVMSDETERKESEEDLRRSEARFRAAVDAVQGVLWTNDASGRMVGEQPGWAALTGQSFEEYQGYGWAKAVHPEDAQISVEAWNGAVAERRPFLFEHRVRRHDGEWRRFSVRAIPAFAPTGEIREWVGVHTDITDLRAREAELHDLNETLEARVQQAMAERTQVEEALRQAQKMEAVGQLTGGLAHDFNNLLAGISGSLDLMGTRLSQGRISDVERYIMAAQGAARRAAALTHRLLAFSRRQTLDPKPTDVNRLVAGMEDLIRRTVGPAIKLEVVGTSGLWTTLVDPHQLENALLNLCINARDAMPDGGRITIETANKWLDRWAARKHDVPEGQYLSLCVTDTGTGMSPEVQARAFDPFFTTKPIGEGTGLGLSMIYGFAKQSGGQVRIYSELGQGTTVCIYLPRHMGEEPAVSDEGRTETRAHSEQGETVLVVDDEPTVRMLVTDILEELGYTVLEAADSVEGLKVLRSDVRIDLLVTDVGLPGGMNGRQMADAGREVRPDLRVLFITGYAENAAIGNGHLAPGMSVLTKPFAVDILAARIRELIAR